MSSHNKSHKLFFKKIKYISSYANLVVLGPENLGLANPHRFALCQPKIDLVPYPNMLNVVVGLNGVYDIACSISIIAPCNNMLSVLHVQIFQDNVSTAGCLLWHRIMAYWVLTYGMVRLASAVYCHRVLHALSAGTYLVEAMAYILEGFYFKTVVRHQKFLICSCFALCLWQSLHAGAS